MKPNIHPEYQTITISCACGNSFDVGSTASQNISVEICSNCNPFYTGKAKLVDTARRIDKFESRRQKSLDMKKASDKSSQKTPKTAPKSPEEPS